MRRGNGDADTDVDADADDADADAGADAGADVLAIALQPIGCVSVVLSLMTLNRTCAAMETEGVGDSTVVAG